MKTLQKFASVHATVYYYVNHKRYIVDRQTFKERRSPPLAAWQALVS